MKKNKEKGKIGLVLGSGAARGLVHIGVIKAIEESKINLDFITGSSMGALIGGAYASGLSINEIEEIALNTNWRQLAKLFQPTISFSSLANTKNLDKQLREWIGNKTFDDLKIPFSCVATDIQTSKMIVLEKGDLVNAIKSSVSLPIIFSPVNYHKYKLVDGGLVNPTPIDIAREKVEKVIAVNLRKISTYGLGIKEEKNIESKIERMKELSINEKFQALLKQPFNFFFSSENEENDLNLWRVLYHMFIIIQVQISDLRMQIAKPDLLIEPDTSQFKAFEFSKAKELIQIGYETAKSELKNFK